MIRKTMRIVPIPVAIMLFITLVVAGGSTTTTTSSTTATSSSSSSSSVVVLVEAFQQEFRRLYYTTHHQYHNYQYQQQKHLYQQNRRRNTCGVGCYMQKQEKIAQAATAITTAATTTTNDGRRNCFRRRTWSRFHSTGLSSLSSSTTLSATVSSSTSTDDESILRRKQMMITFSRCLFLLGLFATGFWTGIWYNNKLAATATATKATAKATATAARGSVAATSFLRQFPIMSVLLVVVLARDVWRNVIPNWAKPRLVERAIRDTKLLLGIKQITQSKQQQQQEEGGGGKREGVEYTSTSSNDIGDIDTLIGKINAIKTIMTKTIDAKIIDDDDDDDDRVSSWRTTPKKKKKKKKPKFNLSTAFFTYQNLIRQFKDVQHSPVRDMWYHQRQQQQQQRCGQLNNTSDAKSSSTQQPSTVSRPTNNNVDEKESLLKRLPLLLDMADWAYDEDPSGKPLKELLNEQNYTLVKHDKTPLPGYLGHYVAIPTQQDQEPHKGKDQQQQQQQRKEQRRAVIGVKGTSGLEDFMTDLCGASVELDVTVDANEWKRKMMIHPLPRSSRTTTSADEKDDSNSVVTIRAHEGVAIASRRLADDLKPIVENLLLPQDYKLTIVGHSLGAAGASLLSIILCAEIPSLQPSQLEVFAFASPPTLDLQTAKAVESFTTTIVNNNDVIPRMNVESVGSTVDLLKILDTKRCRRDDELDKIRQTYRQQHRWWYQRWKNRSQFVDQKKELMDDTPLLSDMEYLDVLYNATSNSHEANVDNPDHLYVPGKVVLLYKSWSNETSTNQVSKHTDKDVDSSTSPQHIIMSNIDGTKDTQTTTTLAEVATMTSMDDEDNDNEDGNLAPSSSPTTSSSPDRVVFCETTSPPIRILELDPTLLDDHMTDGYRRSLQSVLYYGRC